jgi:hypothetical protein
MRLVRLSLIRSQSRYKRNPKTAKAKGAKSTGQTKASFNSSPPSSRVRRGVPAVPLMSRAASRSWAVAVSSIDRTAKSTAAIGQKKPLAPRRRAAGSSRQHHNAAIEAPNNLALEYQVGKFFSWSRSRKEGAPMTLTTSSRTSKATNARSSLDRPDAKIFVFPGNLDMLAIRE